MDKYLNTLLTDPNSIKAVSQLNNNVDDDTIGATIRTVQKVYLQEIIGSELLRKLQLLVYNVIVGNEDNIDDAKNEAYKTLLDEYVEPYLISKVQVEICVPITLKIRNIGVSTDTDTNVTSAMLSDVRYVRSYYETQNCSDATRLSKYLCKMKESYPELSAKCECGHFVAPNIGKTYANTGLWLGTDNNECGCGR